MDTPSTARAPHQGTDRIRAKARPCLPEAPLIPTSWPWVAGVFLGVPLVLVILRPEVVPDAWPDRLRHYLTTVIATVGIGGPLYAAYVFLMPRILLRIAAPAWRFLLHAGVIVGAVIGGKIAISPLLHYLCRPFPARNPVQESLIATITASLVIMATTSFTRLERRTREIERREEEAREAALRAELAALQARTNPHFLFNSLNSVASLIATDPTSAEETLERLAGLFRYALDGSRRGAVPLGEELRFVEDYLDVEAIRFGDRLRWSIDVAPELSRVRVPPLLLQPLVENAVRHGVGQRKEGGRVVVKGHTEGDRVVLSVCDDGPGTSPHRGTGTSLDDLAARLDVAYDGAAEVRRLIEEDGHRVCLDLPREMAREAGR